MLRFTVIIPTHNRPTYLAEAIASVYAQTYADWELLVIDDGSEPPVRELVLSAKQDDRLRYHYQTNIGLGATRQVGVELARGEYLCYLDDDDYFLPVHLATLDAAMRAHGDEPALYKTGIIRLEEGKLPQRSTLFDNDRPALPQHWQHTDSMFPYAIPREVALIEPSVQYYFSEDFNWLGRLMLKLPVRQIAAYTVVYRWHGENRTRADLSRRALRGRLAAVAELYAYPEMAAAVPASLFKQLMAHQCWHWTRQCIRSGRWRNAAWGFAKGCNFLGRAALPEALHTLGVGGKEMLRPAAARLAVSNTRRYLRKEIRHLSIQIYLRTRAHDLRHLFLLAATHRSGSTWLMHLIADLLPVMPNFEPLHPLRAAVPRELGFGHMPVVNPQTVTPARREFIEQACCLRRSTKWTLQYTTVRQASRARYILTKTVRAGQLFPWLLDAFPLRFPPILLLRHPLATALSHRQAFGIDVDLPAMFAEPLTAQNRRYYRHRDFLESLPSDLSRRTAVWCLDNQWTLHAAADDPRVRVVYYEDLLLQPIETLWSIIDVWQIGDQLRRLPESLDVRQPSATADPDDLRGDPYEQLQKPWQLTTSAQRAEVQAVLDHFGVALYHADDPLPRRKRPT